MARNCLLLLFLSMTTACSSAPDLEPIPESFNPNLDAPAAIEGNSNAQPEATDGDLATNDVDAEDVEANTVESNNVSDSVPKQTPPVPVEIMPVSPPEQPKMPVAEPPIESNIPCRKGTPEDFVGTWSLWTHGGFTTEEILKIKELYGVGIVMIYDGWPYFPTSPIDHKRLKRAGLLIGKIAHSQFLPFTSVDFFNDTGPNGMVHQWALRAAQDPYVDFVVYNSEAGGAGDLRSPQVTAFLNRMSSTLKGSQKFFGVAVSPVKDQHGISPATYAKYSDFVLPWIYRTHRPPHKNAMPYIQSVDSIRKNWKIWLGGTIPVYPMIDSGRGHWEDPGTTRSFPQEALQIVSNIKFAHLSLFRIEESYRCTLFGREPNESLCIEHIRKSCVPDSSDGEFINRLKPGFIDFRESVSSKCSPQQENPDRYWNYMGTLNLVYAAMMNEFFYKTSLQYPKAFSWNQCSIAEN